MSNLMIGRGAEIACEIQVVHYPLAAESAGDDLGLANLKPVLTKVNADPNPSQLSRSNSRSSRFSSQRFSGSLQSTATASIIALPKKIQHSVSGSRCRFRPTSTRIFPKIPNLSSGGGGRRKTVVPDNEPSSPKVSCIGKVLSERERGKCKKKFQFKSSEKKRKMKNYKKNDGRGTEATGCWGPLAVLFHCFGGRNRVMMAESVGYDPVTPPAKSFLATSGKRSPPRLDATVEEEPPQLCSMKRFASGRRSASWECDLGAEDGGMMEGEGHEL